MTLIHLAITIIAILIAAHLIPGVGITLTASIILAVVLGIINMFFRPIIRILTLPLNILTLGIFSLFVNAALIMLASHIVPDFSVATFWTAFFFSIVVSLVSAFFSILVRK
jgi:putative membrane protein